MVNPIFYGTFVGGGLSIQYSTVTVARTHITVRI